MADELLFQVEQAVATKATPITLADTGLTEREHLQEWVLANPEIVGEDVLILTLEFDRWLSPAKSPGKVRDRLDILGLDGSGALVVCELKRDKAPDTVEMQAVKYAAMAAQFTSDKLAQAYQRHLASTGEKISVEEAGERLAEHAGGALDPKILRRPRIVLIAGDYPDTTMTSAIWLTQMGVDVTLVRYQAYATPAGVHITTSRMWPLEQAEDLVVRPEEREEVETARETRRRTRNVVARIHEAVLLDDGAELTLAPNSQVPVPMREQLDAWLTEDPERGRAYWIAGGGVRCLRWAVDGAAWSATGLVMHIIAEACGQQPQSITGPMWWSDTDGLRLYEILEEHTGEPVYSQPTTERDWSDLHRILASLQPGEWTTYKDLADAIGSSPIAVGQHVAKCDDCPQAYRVLTSRRSVSEGFQWGDSDRDDDPQTLLEQEGIAFDADGRADPAARRQFA